VSDAYETIVGKVCIERGWVTREQLVDCLKEISSVDEPAPEGSGSKSRLTDMLVARGLVKGEQMEALRDEVAKILESSASYTVVRKSDSTLGQILVKTGKITKEQLIESLSIQQFAASKGGAVPRLGEVLIQKGYVTFAVIEEAVRSQKEKVVLHCSACGAGYQVVDYDPKKKYLCKKCTGALVIPGQAPPDVPEEVAKAATNSKNILGKYVVVRELGRGGMGAVYKAWDNGLRRWVALKILLGTGASEELHRFRREAQTAAALRHPHIVGIYEVTTIGEKHIIAMEYVDGRSLAGERLPAKKAAELLSQVAHAVEFAHAKGIIHRDIKPHNVMIDKEEKPFVMDFGLAKSLEGSSHITMAGTVVGTPSYMAPEQAEGRISKVDRQSDVYSLGAVLFECLTGKPPFKGANPVETMRMVVNDDPPLPSRLAPGVPKDLETIVLKALEKDKAKRYASARAMAEDLDQFLGGREIRAKRASAGARVARQMKRQWAPLAAVFAAVVVVGVVGTMIAASGKGKRDEIRALLDAGDRLLQADKAQEALTKYEAAKALARDDASVQERIDRARTSIKSAEEIARRRREEEEARAKAEAAAGAAAQPEYETGRLTLESAKTDLYRQGANLAGVDAQLQQAADRFTKAISLHPAHAGAHHLRGVVHFLRQDYFAAEKDFTAALGHENRLAAASYDRGRVYIELATEARGQTGLRGPAAEEEWKQYRDRAKADLNAYKEQISRTAGPTEAARLALAEALLAFAEADYSKARQLCDALIAKQTSNEEVYKLKGDALSEIGHGTREAAKRDAAYREAVASYDEALKRRVNYPEAFLARGHARAHVKDVEGSAQDLEKAVAIGRGSAGWHSQRGTVLYELGRRTEAARDFEAALLLRPNDVGVLNNLGLIYYHQKDDRRALEMFERAVKNDPKSAASLANRGLARSGAGDSGGALLDFEAALAIDPKRTQVLYYRGTVLNQRREWAKAEEDLGRVVAASPTFADGWYQRAVARFNLDRLREAIADWERALELNTSRREEAERRIAEAKARLGR
jgi:tetratricopeptide (TPR) repeat protein/predicted Ser/Thr protein kinase